MRIQSLPLGGANTHPKLSIISPELTTQNTRTGNQGTSTKTPDIAPCTDLYGSAPSGLQSRAVLSSSRNTPREIVRSNEGSESITVAFLERHPFTSQSFIPMGGDQSPAYVVIVADDATDGQPELSSIKAYLVPGNIGVCYSAGVWHAPMATIRKVSHCRMRGSR